MDLVSVYVYMWLRAYMIHSYWLFAKGIEVRIENLRILNLIIKTLMLRADEFVPLLLSVFFYYILSNVRSAYQTLVYRLANQHLRCSILRGLFLEEKIECVASSARCGPQM